MTIVVVQQRRKICKLMNSAGLLAATDRAKDVRRGEAPGKEHITCAILASHVLHINVRTEKQVENMLGYNAIVNWVR